MLKVSFEHEIEAYNSIAYMEKVKEVYRIAGEFQLFVIVQAETESILHRLLDTIRDIPGVIGIAKVLISKEDDPLNGRTMRESSRSVGSASGLDFHKCSVYEKDTIDDYQYF